MKIRWQRFFAVSIISLFLVVAVFAPIIAPQPDPEAPGAYKRIGNIGSRIPQPPSSSSPLGTVPTQLDVFFTLIWGVRYELVFGLSVASIAAILGTTIGLVSGYKGGWINRITMRLTDGFLTFPLIAAVVFVNLIHSLISAKLIPNSSMMQLAPMAQGVEMLQTGTFDNWFVQRLAEAFLSVRPFPLTIILLSWMPYARMINDLVIRLKSTEYIEAAQAIGVSQKRIIFRHLLPNCLPQNIVLAARDVGGVVILRATFTYIGLAGGSPWAAMLILGKNFVIGPGGSPGTYWWVYLPISAAIVLFGLGWNLLGDEINIWLNPREK